MLLPLALLLLAPRILPLDAFPPASAEVLAEDHVWLSIVFPEGNQIGAMLKLLQRADVFCRGKGKAVSVTPMVIAPVPKSDRAARRQGTHRLTEEYRCVAEPAAG